jgi:hypothetical protein
LAIKAYGVYKPIEQEHRIICMGIRVTPLSATWDLPAGGKEKEELI